MIYTKKDLVPGLCWFSAPGFWGTDNTRADEIIMVVDIAQKDH